MTKAKLLGLTATIVSSMAFSAAFADGHTGNRMMPLGELEFMPLPGVPIEIAVLWGNPQEGASAVMMRFPANFPGGMHSHTFGYHGVVISGASRHWVEGESEAETPLLQPGDYWFQVGGEVHQDSFPTDEETIFYLQFEGPIDTFFAE